MSRTLKILGIVLIVVSLLLVCDAGLSAVRDLKEAPFLCDGSTAPAGALPPNEGQPSDHVGLMPIGVSCSWDMADGTTESVLLDSFNVTYFGYGGVVVFVGGIVSLWFARRLRAGHKATAPSIAQR